MEEANEVTGRVYKQFNKVEYYFHLKETNDSLVKANERLINALAQNFEIPDTAKKLFSDTVKLDTVAQYRKFIYMPAKVIGNSVNLPNNYLQLSRGSLQGVTKDLGVIDANNSIVGTVIDVSDNYAVVMSLLHLQSSISARLQKTGEEGTVIWDGSTPNSLLLKGIGKNVKLKMGDSVVTSGFTDRFPYGLLIGTIREVRLETKTNMYAIKLKTGANFYNLQFVNVIDNLKKEAPKALLEKVKKVNG
jgi:rod shape-determining protein MreC